MKILSLHQQTSLERVQPESGYGDVGEGGIVQGMSGVDMVGTLADGQVWVFDSGSGTLIPGDVSAPITVEDEGTPLATAADTLNFVGTGVTATGSGGTKTITIPGVAAGTYELANEGGQDLLNALGSVSGAVSVDPTLGNVASLTLTGTTTTTIAAPVGSGGSTLEWWVTQDGTGGRALTIAATGGSVTNSTTPDTTAGVTVRYVLDRLPGTSNDWIVNIVGGSTFATPAIVLGTAAAAGAATTAIRSDATIVAFDATAPTTSAIGDAAATGSAAKAARRDHVHGREALSTATPLVESGSGAVGTGTKSSREDHVHPVSAGTAGVGTYGLLVEDGVTAPPVTLYTEDGTDWIYADG